LEKKKKKKNTRNQATQRWKRFDQGRQATGSVQMADGLLKTASKKQHIGKT